jgi:hypothetical protein
VLRSIYSRVQDRDRRWRSDWRDVAVMVNPNGPLFETGSDGDNGQTGRKLVMVSMPARSDGGGALSGRHLTHIDRIGAYAAREAAVCAVRSRSKTAEPRSVAPVSGKASCCCPQDYIGTPWASYMRSDTRQINYN